jgi:lysophospholipase L1-like esterase
MFLTPKEFDVWSKGSPNVIYEHSFRIRRYRPNLHDLRHRSEPQGLTTNSFGLVGPEISLQKPPLTRRVALLGDSLSQGWGTDQNRSYVRVLENRMNASPAGAGSQRFEFLNFSVGGYCLTQMLDVAEEDVSRFEPDVYLLALTEQGAFRNWAEHLTWMIRLGIDPKYDFLRETVRQSGASATDSPLVILGDLAPYRIPVIRGIFERIQARAARDHAAFIVLLVPSLEDGDMNQKRFTGMRELLASLDIPVVDLLDTFSGFLDMEPFRINPFDVHPNSQGHRVIAENLYAKLQARPDLWKALVGQAAAPVRQPAF